MSEEMECMCLQCGISLYLDVLSVALEDPGTSETKLLKNVFCSECGGQLMVIGKAADEPHYRLK
jgi:DNA-directed RNA polymerase subunit RPC12/RpoP